MTSDRPSSIPSDQWLTTCVLAVFNCDRSSACPIERSVARTALTVRPRSQSASTRSACASFQANCCVSSLSRRCLCRRACRSTPAFAELALSAPRAPSGRRARPPATTATRSGRASYRSRGVAHPASKRPRPCGAGPACLWLSGWSRGRLRHPLRRDHRWRVFRSRFAPTACTSGGSTGSTGRCRREVYGGSNGEPA
jgi:hypothetical protein